MNSLSIAQNNSSEEIKQEIENLKRKILQDNFELLNKIILNEFNKIVEKYKNIHFCLNFFAKNEDNIFHLKIKDKKYNFFFFKNLILSNFFININISDENTFFLNFSYLIKGNKYYKDNLEFSKINEKKIESFFDNSNNLFRYMSKYKRIEFFKINMFFFLFLFRIIKNIENEENQEKIKNFFKEIEIFTQLLEIKLMLDKTIEEKEIINLIPKENKNEKNEEDKKKPINKKKFIIFIIFITLIFFLYKNYSKNLYMHIIYKYKKNIN